MGKAIYTMTLDLNTTFSQSTVYAKQGDTDRQLIITLRSEGKAFSVDGALVVLSTTTPSGKVIEESTELIDNKIIYNFSKEITASVGSMDVELRIYKDGTVISPTFTLVVEERNNSTPVVESDSFKALDELYVSTNEATIRANDAAHFASSVALELEEARDNGEFKGDKGDKGDTGDKGDKGDRGEPGNSESPDYMIVAPAIPNTASGTAIAITDISPLEHILGVKARSKNKITSISQHTNTYITDGVITQINADTRSGLLFKVVATTNGVTEALATLTANEIGRYSMTFSVKEGLTQLVFGLGGTQRDTTVLLNTLPKGTYTISWENTNVTQGTISWCDMQIEEGTTATPYTPHIADVSTAKVQRYGGNLDTEPTTYDINADGTVEGVTSLYPTTTLVSDTEGIVLDVNYNADTKKYIDNKFAELAALIVNS